MWVGVLVAGHISAIVVVVVVIAVVCVFKYHGIRKMYYLARFAPPERMSENSG